MSRIRDTWYVRLPSGQEIKAKSTAALIHHVQHGTIPKNSRARRTRNEEWVLLEWHAEFNEAVSGVARPHATDERGVVPGPDAPTGIAARLDPLRLHTVGVRGLLEDLLAALDSAFVRIKLLIAVVAAGLVGLTLGGVPWLFWKIVAWTEIIFNPSDADWMNRFVAAGTVLLAVVILAWTSALLARMTHLELSTLRRARWRESLAGFAAAGVRVTLAFLVVLGGALLLIMILRGLPGWIVAGPGETEHSVEMPAPLAGALSIAGVLGELLLWLLIGLAWLLPPILAGENYPLGSGLREWLRLIRAHAGRIVFAELLALAVGLVVSAPLVGLTAFVVEQYPLVGLPLRWLLIGLVLGGLLAYLAVANVFIYLDVKYESH